MTTDPWQLATTVATSGAVATIIMALLRNWTAWRGQDHSHELALVDRQAARIDTLEKALATERETRISDREECMRETEALRDIVRGLQAQIVQMQRSTGVIIELNRAEAERAIEALPADMRAQLGRIDQATRKD